MHRTQSCLSFWPGFYTHRKLEEEDEEEEEEEDVEEDGMEERSKVSATETQLQASSVGPRTSK